LDERGAIVADLSNMPDMPDIPDMPLISLAVIARDEAEALPRLLRGHRGLWDEAVVVDTGSHDGTAGIARALGARVATIDWCEDFSAARNAALAQCRGRWVLVLDADEHLDAAGQRALRDLAVALDAGSTPSGVILPQWNYADDPGLPGWRPLPAGAAAESCGAAGYVIAHQVRLFPGGPATRYSGRVHETVEPSLAAQGLPLLRAEVPVHHHGHRADATTRAARLARDGRLLRLKLQDDPTDPRARYELAAQLLAERRPDLARRLLERLVAEAPEGPRTADAHRLLGRLALAAGRGDEARRCCAAAVALRPDISDAWLDLIRVRWTTGDHPGARSACEQMARLFPLDPRLPALAAQVEAPIADNPKQQTGEA
jgi:tetratricopeptide (TPR) repeat protein